MFEAVSQLADEHAELETRLAAAEVAPGADDQDPGASERERLMLACARARASELDARLALRTQEERLRALAGRAGPGSPP